MSDDLPLAVAVATYKRPDGLRRLMQSLAVQEGVRAHVTHIVVDNDPEGSARPVVDGAQLQGVVYVVEPQPGIAAARNRCLDEAARRRCAAIAFIDDDEVASVRWLASLERTAEASGAEIVSGPVHVDLPPGTAWWIRRLGVFERPQHREGGRVRWPATNNCLVSRVAIDRLDVRMFDEDFSATGGSDADLMARLRAAGATTAWAEGAVVTELVPPERTHFRWIWRRGVRLGNVSARLLMRQRSRASVFAIGLVRIARGLVLLPVAFLWRRRSAGPLALEVPKGVGVVAASVGALVKEYRR